MVKQQLRTAFPNPHCIGTALPMQTAEDRMGYRAHQPLTQYLPTLLFLAFDTALQCGSIGLTPLMWRELGWLTENWHPSRKKGRPAVFTDVQPFQHFHPFSSSSREKIIILPSKSFDCFPFLFLWVRIFPYKCKANMQWIKCMLLLMLDLSFYSKKSEVVMLKYLLEP